MQYRKLKWRFKSEPSNVLLPPYKERIFRPVLKITLLYKGKTTPCFDVLLDSGADICTFHTQIAELLDIDWRHCPEAKLKGINNIPTTGYINNVTIEIGGYQYETEVMFMENFPRDGLLGFHGFLDRIDCNISRTKETIETGFNEENNKIVSLI